MKFKHGWFLQGDCLEIMPRIPAGTVDMVLCDLPYGTTSCSWDAVVPFTELWPQYKRITRQDVAIVLTASQPFTTVAIASNLEMFKYCWVWDKKKPSNFPLAKKQPLKYHEDVVVFARGASRYAPIMVPVPGRAAKKGVNKNPTVFQGGLDRPDYLEKVYTDKYPSSILEFSNADQRNRLHPTQKPVALFEYLIRTYTNPGDLVLDNTAGSGTTAIAAIRSGRQFLCIERDENYYKAACERVAAEERGME